MIWAQKNLWNWSDRIEQQRTSSTNLNVRIAPDELTEKLREAGLPDFVFGCDKPAPLIEGNGLDHSKLVQEPGGHLGDDGDGDIRNFRISPPEPTED
jgi:hypothetical protein